jgi:hypothetical protein
MAGPAAIGLTMGLGGCAMDTEPTPDVSKADAEEGKADGFTDLLCYLIGADVPCDLCEELDWYGDGECDEFCDSLDPDCMMTPLYGVPFGESECHDGVDDDGDGAIDCCDDDCVDAGECVVAVPRYMAPIPPEADCGDCLDNDGDGLVDMDDPDCTFAPEYAAPFEDCSNGIDDDGDGATDCCDEQCEDATECIPVCPRYMAPLPPEGNCGDCIDNDCDGDTDEDDEDCEE